MSTKILDTLTSFFSNSPHPIIFTGAGVSAKAGLPMWKSFVEQLAEGLRANDPLTTQQMHECIRTGDLVVAVDYFHLSRKMLEGDKQKLLATLLAKYDYIPLLPLAQLPFRACITTNFDRSIIDAIGKAKSSVPRDYKFGDVSFKQAQWDDDLYVARIHGAVENTQSMILSAAQFDSLLKNDVYHDFLRICFTQRNVLFLGFSFYDPAIRYIFEELDRRFGAASPGRHVALLPDDISSEFLQKAHRLNIEVVQYSAADYHAELWESIELYKGNRRVIETTEDVASSPLDFTKRYLAACYARAKTHDSSQALREAVLEGIISAILQEVAPMAVSRRELLEKIRLTLGMKGPDAEKITTRAVQSLVDAGLCRRLKDDSGRSTKHAWNGEAAVGDSLGAAIKVLVEGVQRRAFLMEAWTTGDSVEKTMVAFFNQLIRRRGWDLGAAFAAGRAPINVSIESLLNECAVGLAAFDRERLLRVCNEMLVHPSVEESRVLSELGRVSFAVELAFQSPHTVLLHNAILPRKIYFDANVLLPALVPGHPFHLIYISAIARLKKAASSAAVPIALKICSVYINEIISHRKNAEDFARELGGDFQAVARSDALFHGVSNVNVFVGAYANWVENNNEITFEVFMDRFAPYKTEPQLRKWLMSKGFEISDTIKGPKFAQFYQTLEKAYASSLSHGKGAVLISHDASQLSVLDVDQSKGEKAIFVTADRQLQTVATNFANSNVSDMMISHVGLIQMIELMLGGIADGGGLTELLWSARMSDRAQAVRSFFTARGLEQYDEGMAMTMPMIIESAADHASKELERAGLDLDSQDPKKRAAAFRTLGTLEKGFLEGMQDAVKKKALKG